MIEIKNDRIKTDPPKYPLKITGTRLATILGMNPYSTPFQAWAEITKIYKKPFEETKFRAAGKFVEPLQAEFIRRKYNLGKRLVSPSDQFGEDYMQKMYGDFYKTRFMFGGMWDYLYKNDAGAVRTVIEMKTTQAKKKAQWAKSIPPYYILQNALYAYLEGIDDCLMVSTFLEPYQYDNLESIVLNDENTKCTPFKISKALPKFEHFYIMPAKKWWVDHVMTGVSPTFDKANPDDMAIVNELKKQQPKQINLFGYES